MLTVLDTADLVLAPPSRTVKFEGAPYDAAVSFFSVDMDSGGGPGLHTHPYAEVFLVQAGLGLFRTDTEQAEVGPGRIVVATVGTPHAFRNIGQDRLRIVCIHANPEMITEWLEREA